MGRPGIAGLRLYLKQLVTKDLRCALPKINERGFEALSTINRPWYPHGLVLCLNCESKRWWFENWTVIVAIIIYTYRNSSINHIEALPT